MCDILICQWHETVPWKIVIIPAGNIFLWLSWGFSYFQWSKYMNVDHHANSIHLPIFCLPHLCISHICFWISFGKLQLESDVLSESSCSMTWFPSNRKLKTTQTAHRRPIVRIRDILIRKLTLFAYKPCCSPVSRIVTKPNWVTWEIAAAGVASTRLLYFCAGSSVLFVLLFQKQSKQLLTAIFQFDKLSHNSQRRSEHQRNLGWSQFNTCSLIGVSASEVEWKLSWCTQHRFSCLWSSRYIMWLHVAKRKPVVYTVYYYFILAACIFFLLEAISLFLPQDNVVVGVIMNLLLSFQCGVCDNGNITVLVFLLK